MLLGNIGLMDVPHGIWSTVQAYHSKQKLIPSNRRGTFHDDLLS